MLVGGRFAVLVDGKLVPLPMSDLEWDFAVEEILRLE